MAAIVHAVAVITQIGFFEALWALEAWNASHAVLDIIAAISVQRFIFKVMITNSSTMKATEPGGQASGMDEVMVSTQYRNLYASMFAGSLRCPCSLATLSWVMSFSSCCSRSV
jgi:hypothetical protein